MENPKIIAGICPCCRCHNISFFSSESDGSEEKMGYITSCSLCQTEERAYISDMDSDVVLYCKDCNTILFIVSFSDENSGILFNISCRSCGTKYSHDIEEFRRMLEGEVDYQELDTTSYIFSQN